MADKKISGLTDGGPAVLTDAFPISRTTDVATRKLTLSQLMTLVTPTSLTRWWASVAYKSIPLANCLFSVTRVPTFPSRLGAYGRPSLSRPLDQRSLIAG